MPDAASIAEAGSQEEAQTAEMLGAVPVAVRDGALEVSQDLATGSDGPLPAAVGGNFADAGDGAVDGERMEQRDKEVFMAGGGPAATSVAAVLNPGSDAIGAVTDQLAPSATPVLGESGDASTSLPSVVSSTPLVHGLSPVASVAGQMPERELVDAVEAADGAGVDEAAVDEMPATLDDVHAAIEPVALEGNTGPERPVSAREALLEENDTAAPAEATDGAFGADEAMPISAESAGVEAEQTVGEVVSDDTATAEAPVAMAGDVLEVGTVRSSGRSVAGEGAVWDYAVLAFTAHVRSCSSPCFFPTCILPFPLVLLSVTDPVGRHQICDA